MSLTLKEYNTVKVSPEDLEEDEYTRKLLNFAAMYMIANGVVPPKATQRHMSKFYSELFGMTVPKKKQTKWLCQIGRILERNQHRDFTLTKDSVKFVL